MSAALAAVVVEAKDGSRSGCCGTPACGHTVIQHGSHRGFLSNGQLLCRPAVGLPLVPCTLDMDDCSCSLIEGQDGHIHGPCCGHEQVPHGDHMDYLVGGRLHHQVASGICCSRSCLKELPISAVVDHGPVTVLHHRSTAQRQPQDCSASTSSRAQLTLNDEQPASAMHRSSSHLSDDSSVVQQPEILEVITKVYAAGICCPSEVGIVHRVLEGLPGVSEVQVNAVSKVVTVRHDAAATSPATLVATLNAARLEATLGTKEVVTGRASWLPPHYILGCGLLLLVSLFSYLPASGAGYLKYAALGCLVLGMPPVLLKAWVALRGWQVDINVLMTVAVAGALALQDFIEPAIIVFLFSFAQWLEHRCISQASNAVAALLTLQPETAVLADSGMAVPVGQVVVGDRILVRPGDRVACDGVVESGCGSVDQSMLTGEARAVVKSLEDAVFGGTINVGGTTLVVRVTSASADSSLAKLAQVMESAMAHKTKRELVLERFARIYSPVVIASAILLAAVPSALDPSQWHRWVYLALEVLVTACPCALVLSAPVANVCALTRAAQHGVLLKSSSVLQAFASLEVLSFDKTGTLTQGHFALVETLTMPHRWTEDQLLQFAAALEQHCNHPLAASIIGEAASRGLPWLTADDVVVLPGVGVEGRVGSHLVTLCSLGEAKRRTALVAVSNSATAATQRRVWEVVLASTGTACCLLVDGTWAGALVLCDQPRPEAVAVVARLRANGIRCALLSGDNEDTVAKVGQQLGLDPHAVYGGLLPEQKLEIIRALKMSSTTFGIHAGSSSADVDVGSGRQPQPCTRARQRVVAHVGDGMNDAPALAAADVGVAMGVGGSSLAIEAADVALFTNNLGSLVFLRALAKYTTWLIVCNISWAVVTKAVVLILIGLDKASLVIAVSADVGSSLVVVLISLTVLRFTHALHGQVHTADGATSTKGSWIVRRLGKLVKVRPRSCCHGNHSHPHQQEGSGTDLVHEAHQHPCHHSTRSQHVPDGGQHCQAAHEKTSHQRVRGHA